MRAAEALIFLPVAAVLHLGVWVLSPASFGSSSLGGPGAAQVSLASAAAQHTVLAREWKAAPQTAPDPVQPRPASYRPNPPQPPVAHPGPVLSAIPSLSPVLPAALPVLTPPPQLQPVPRPQSPAQPLSDLPPPAENPPAPAEHKVLRSSPLQPQPARPDTSASADTRTPKAPPEPEPAPRTPTAKSKPPAAASPAQTASGGGAARSGQTGKSGQDATQSSNAATRNALQARWGAKIQRRVHRRLIYPRGTTGTGVAKVALTISPSGKLTGLQLTRSSGVAAFDKAALGAVRRAGQFPKAPKELREQSYSFTLSLSFRR